MKRRILSLICAVVLFGCAKEESMSPGGNSAQSEPDYEPIGRILTAAEIHSLALQLPTIYSTDPTTKSTSKRVQEIVPFGQTVWGTTVRTKSADADPTAEAIKDIYIVNYEDSAGFAIVSADNRLPNVLAYSDKGTLSENEKLPQGVRMLLAGLPEYARERIEEVNAVIANADGIYDSMPDKDGYYRLNQRYMWGKRDEMTKGPLVNTKWGQGKPFNDYMPRDETFGTLAPAGCVAVALGQIMVAHQWPLFVRSNRFIEPYYIAWNRLALNTAQEQIEQEPTTRTSIAALLEVIGRECGMRYGIIESSATNEGALQALQNMGYKTDGSVQALDVDKAIAEIAAGRPVYVSGRTADLAEGHAWMVCGYQYYRDEYWKQVDLYDAYMNFVRTETTVEYVSLKTNGVIYCNWGNYGEVDGWFAKGMFQSTLGDFSYANEMIIGISPI